MKTLCILSRKAPYGSVDVSEAIRHAMGAVLEDLTVRLILLGSGVNAARKDQDTGGTEYESVGSSIGDCVDMDVEVYAEMDSMEREGLDREWLVDGVKVADSSGIAALVRDSDQCMVF